MFSKRYMCALSLLVGVGLWAQTPNLVNGTPSESFAGEQFCFSATLTNAGAPGFGPYLRLILPPDISFDSSTYLGTGMTIVTVGTFPAAPGNQLMDPLTDTSVTGPDGATLILIIYPLGSIVQGGPLQVAEICATISTAAVVGVPLDVSIQPVYRYGDTATGDNGPIFGAPVVESVTPTVITMDKTADVAEGERAPGPAFTYTYTIGIDVANGKSVFDLVIDDLLPADVAYVGPPTIVGGVNGLVTATPAGPGGTLSVTFDRIDGAIGSNDATITYSVYIIDTLDESNCNEELQTNTVTLDAEHPDNNPLPQLMDTSEVMAKHLPIQKGVSPGAASPGDLVTFTLNFQVTEYGTASSLTILDTLPDGYTFGSHQGMTVGGSPVAITPTVTPFGDGTTDIFYDVHAVTGNLLPTTTGTISYTATIDQNYTPAPDPILASDSLTNNVSNTFSLTAGATACTDDSSATVEIIPVNISKSIVNVQAEYVPGETVTYRLELDVPSGDTEAIVFEDFFPLPVFDVASLDLTFGNDIRWAPSDTLGLTPTAITINAAENALEIEWPNITTTSTQTLAVDVDIVVEDDPFADELFLTNLFQASTVNSNSVIAIGVAPVQIFVRAPELVITKGISASDNVTADATISPSPAALPVDGDITASDAGDTVTYVITVENIGGASAYDVVITDPAVAGLTGATIVSVVDGNGTPIAFRDPTDVDAPTPPALPIPTDLTSGIKLDVALAGNDDNPAGGGAPFSTDTAIITLQYSLEGTVVPEQIITNTASVSWASQSGAVVFPAVTDEAQVTIASPLINKSVTAIAPGYAGNLNQVQIGEVITYQVVVTLPEGTSQNVTFSDLVDNGLALTDVVSITPSSGDVTTDVGGGFPGILAGAVFTNSGAGSHQLDRLLTLDFGNVTNANTDDATAETITIVYRVRVINWDNNNRGDVRNNQADWIWDNPNGAGTLLERDNASNVTITEPELQITKTLSSATGDAGDTPVVTFRIRHTGDSNADAFDVTLEDILPAGFSYLPGFTTFGLAPDVGPAEAGGTISATWNSFPQGSTAQIVFAVSLDGTVEPTETIENCVDIFWESLATADEGVLPSPPNNTLGVERTGDTSDTGGAANNYTDRGCVTIDVPQASVAKSVDSISPGGASPNVTSGDTVTYRLTVTLPEGTTSGLTLSDALPPGFSFQSASLDTAGFNGSVSLASAIASGTVATGQTVAITMGAATTVTGDNNGSNNSFAVLVDALVEGTESVNDGLPAVQTKTNTVTLDYTGNGATIQDSVPVSFAEPELAITKTMSPDTGLQAGDTVTISINLQNTGTAPAHDVVITDTLNNGGELLFDTSSAAEGTTPAGFTFGFADPTVTYTAAGTVAAGANISFTFTATVRNDVVTGSTYDNTASVAGDSQTGVVSGERASNDTGTDSATTLQVSTGKALTGSTEAWTSDTAPIEAAIGEILTYTLTFDIPQGVTQEDGTNPIITDTLPAGFEYLTGTATIRVDNVDTTMSGSNLGGGLNPIPTSDTAIVPTVNGQDLEFDLGDLTNNDNDAGTEQVVLIYDVLVRNTSDNNRTNSKTNTGSLNYINSDSNPQSITDTATLTIAEPNLGITKSAAPATVIGGSTVTFTVVLTNAADTNVTRAWEPVIVDDLNLLTTRYQNPAVTSATHSAQGDITACAVFAGNVLTVDPSSCLAAANNYLDPGETITVVYTADIDPAIQFEEDVDNRATFTASSLPGDNGTGASTPGAPGTSTGERTGSGVGENDLNGSDDAQVTAGKPTLSKTGDTNLQILDTTTMTLSIDVPVGTTGNFVITDDLPSGLRYTGTATITPPASNFTSSNTPTAPAADTDPLVFDFGTITNSDTVPQTITITYEVQVENILANQNATALTNTATASYTGASLPLPSDTATITVIEPDLEVTKTITAGAAGSDAGDTISYQFTVQNSGATATAYRVDIQDVLPANLLGGTPTFDSINITNPGNAIVLNSDGTTPLTSVAASISTTTNTDDTLSFPLVNIPAGVTLTVTYDAVLTTSAVAGETLTNTLTATYNSLSGGGGRDSTDSTDDDDGNLDNYGETDTSTVTVDAAIAIQKSLNAIHADNDFTIGDLITYDIRVDVIEGITGGISVTDVLPTGLDYEGPIRVVAGPHISYNGTGVAVEAPAGTLTIDMGDITNTADGNTANDFLIIEIDARMEDIGGNVAPGILTNSVSLTSDVGSAGPDTQAIDIVEPNLAITKVPDDSTPSLGDEVTFTITVSHSGSTADAFDVILTDAIPSGLTYVLGSHGGDGSVDETDPANPEFDLGTITLAEMSKSFSFRCTVDLDATVGTAITNTINGTYDGQSGSPTVERSYNSNGSDDVTPSTPAVIDAQKTVAIAVDGGTAGVVDPGDTLEYTITLTNGSDPVTNVIFTDPIPNNSTYVAASLSTSKGSIDDSGDPLSVDIGPMAAVEVVTITFQVTVDGGTPVGTIISNQGSVDSDETVPEPTDEDGVDENGDQPTDVRVGGPAEAENALYVHKQVVWLTDNDSSGDVSPTDTLRYLLTIENRGDETLTNVSVTDTIPSGLTYVGASATIPNAPPNNITVVGSSVSITIPSLLPSLRQSFTATFDVTIDNPLVDNNGGANDETFLNQAATDSDQTDPSESDGNGDPTDGNQPTQITAYDDNSGTPIIDVEKRWQLFNDLDGDGLVDPNDTLLYTILVLNTGGADATDLRLTDTIPVNTTLVAGTVTTDRGIVITEDPVNINIGTLEPGGLVQVQFQVTVDGGTPDGTIIPNQATVTGDGGSINEPSDDNGDDSDGKNPTLTPVDTGGGSASGTPGGLTKGIFATSEAGSSSSEVLIGEIVTFRVSVNIPAGTLREVTVVDTLPTGLAYVSGTARLARTFETGLASSEGPGGINSAATGTFVNLADGSDLTQSGQDLELFLGDIINSDNDVNAETYTLEVQVLVENIAGNQAGTTRTNQATISYLNGLNQLQSLTPVTQDVTILEPNLAVTKSANPTMMTTAGGDITFTVTVTNPDMGNTAPAYDVQVDDILSAEWTGLSIDSVTPSGGVSGVTDNSAGTTVDITVGNFPVDGQLVIIYTATAAGPLTPATLTNTATVSWTSTPGTQGTGSGIPGNPGDSDGERDGSDGVGGLNDYTTSDTSDVVIGDTSITKTILNPQARYAIGDLVDYQVEIAVPPTAVLTTASIADVLDEGLTYETGSLGLVWNSLTSSTNPSEFARTDNDPAAGQETLTLDLGTFSNPTGSVQTLVLTYQALVDNILGNQNNTNLSNSATLSYDDPGGGATIDQNDTTTLTVGEPHLSLSKTITSGITNLDAGDTVDFQIVIENDGTTDAFEVVVSDTLPTGLENVTSLVVASTTGGAETPTFTNNGTDWTTSAFDLPESATVTITFTATLENTVIPGQQIQNSAEATFSSQDGTDPNERDGSTPASDQDDDSDLNNYNDTDSAPIITVDDPVAIDKSFYPNPANTTYTIGESLTYRIQVTVPEGTTNSVTVIDTLPDHVRFLSESITVGNLGMTLGATGPASEAGQVLTWNIGTVSNPSNGSTTDDTFSIDITVVIEDVTPQNVNGAILGNNVQLDFVSASGPQSRFYDADAGTPGIQPLELTIVEPDLAITKTANPTSRSQGDLVNFSILIDHLPSSTADAFDLQVVDTLPLGLTYETGSANVAPSIAGQVLTFDIAALTLLDDQTTITYQARVDLDVLDGSILTNSADLSYTSMPGDNSDERSYSDSDTSSVTVAETTFIDAQKTVAIAVDGGTMGQVDFGDTLEYTIVITNTGADATNVVFTDPLPNNSTYVPASLSAPGAISVDDSGDPLIVNIGNMSNGATFTLTFQVTVNAGTPTGTIIRNQGDVDSDQTVPEPTDEDGDDGNGDQPTDVTVGGPPSLTNALYVHKTVQLLTDNDLSGDVTPGDVLRYSFYIYNYGSSTLTNVTVTDNLPTGLTYVAASEMISTGSIGVVAPAVTITIPSLAPQLRAPVAASVDVTVDGPLYDSDANPNQETFVNQAATDSDQTEPGQSDGNGDPSDGYQPTTITAVDGVSGSPLLDLEKRWSLAIDLDGDGLVDPDDTIEYQLVLINAGSAAAEDVFIDDTIPADTTLVVGSVTTSQGVVVTEDPIEINLGDVAPGATVVMTFRVTVDSGTPDGTIIPNQATASGNNFSDEPSDDNGDDSDGKNPTLTPVDTGGGSSSGTPGGLTKGIFATSEAGSTNPNVLIGELVTFRVGVSIPVGTLREAMLIDTLPTGLLYMPNTARLARTFETGLASSENPGGINSAATGTFVNLTDGSELVQMGQDLELFLGDVINSDNDANEETYILEIQVLVENIASNLAGSTLTNQATISYLNGLGQPQTLSPVSQGVTIIEPALMLSKTALPTMMTTAGGDVTFTVIVTNPAGSHVGPGYDVQITDALGAAWTVLSVDSLVPSGGVSGVVDNTVGTTLDVSIDTFPVDGQFTITYTATAPGILRTGILTNTVLASWTSTPGPFGTGDGIPGPAGDPDGERTGGGGVNSYDTSAQAEVVIGDTNITKTILNPQVRYAIGDLVDYQVQVSVPPTASLANAQIDDILDEGLTYQGGLAIDWQGLTSSINPTDFLRTDNSPTAGEETLTLDLGTFANPQPTVQTLTLTYSVQVDDLLLNQEGSNLSNGVTLSYDDPGGGSAINQTDSLSITVGEPHLTLDKAIISGQTGSDAGDPIGFQVVVGNDGTTTAFEVVLTDILPTGLEAASALTVTSATGGAETPTFINNGTDWSTSAFDLPVGATVTITFTAILSNTVIPGQSIQNTVSASFTSQDGNQPGERDGSTPDSNQDDDTDLDNYNHSDSAPIIVVADTIAINKAFYPDPVNTTYTIGDSVGYRITVSLNEGTVDDLVVTDTLPAGLRFESALVGSGNLGMTHGYIGPPSVAGQVVSFDLGQVVNPANALDTDDYLTIDLTVTVENIATNQDGVFLENHAALSFTGPSGTETRDFDSDAGTPGIQGLELEIVEPDLQLLKSVTPIDVWPGTEATYTLTIDHTAASRADAFDVVIVDTLPIGVTYVNGSASLAPTSVVGQVLTFTIPVLTLLDDQFSITYDGLVDVNATLGVPLVNTAIATYSTQSGDHPDERDGDDGSGGLNDLETDPVDAQVIPTRPVVTMFKVDTLAVDLAGDGNASPGDTLGYVITVENSGNAPATNVVISDMPDVNTTIVAGSITTTQGSVTGGQAGTPPVVVDLGTLAAATIVTVEFQVQINDPLDPAVTSIGNQAVMSSDELPDLPSDDPDDPTGDDDPTDTPIVQVDLGVSKTDDPDPIALGGGDITYTILIDNFGPSDATQVVAIDQLPTEFNYVSSTTSSGTTSYDGGTHSVTIDVGALAASGQVTATITVTPTVEGVFTNGVSVSALEHDFNPDNDSDTEDTTIVEGVDLWLTKTVNNPNPDYQEVITFTVRITNDGPSIATGIVVSDSWPADLVYVTHTTTSGSYDHGTRDWNIASMAPNTFEELEIQARVDGLGTMTNLAEITAHNEVDLDSTPGNGDPAEDDIDSVDIQVNDALDLVLVKRVIAENPYPGSRVIYTIEVQNLGPAPSIGTVVTDHLPAEIEYEDSTATQGAYNPVSGIWDIGYMDPDDIHMLTIYARISRDAPIGVEIVNAATVTSELIDIDITNNDDEVPIVTVAGVPTLGEWMLIAFVGIMMVAALRFMRRHP